MRPHYGWHLTVLIPSTPQGSHHNTIIWISSALGWIGGGLVGSCPSGSELGSASGTNLGESSLPFVELLLHLTSTSWELTWVCLLHWSPRMLLGEWPCFSCEGSSGPVIVTGISSSCCVWWPVLHSCSKGELHRRHARAAAWSSQFSVPEKRPIARWHLPLQPSVLAFYHAS